MKLLKIIILSSLIILNSCSKENNYQSQKKDNILIHRNATNPNDPNFKIPITKHSKIVFPDTTHIISYTIDEQNNIFLMDSKNGKILKYDLEGNFLTSFGNYGSGPGEFSMSKPIVLLEHEGNIIFQDGIKHQMIIFNNNGEFIKTINVKNIFSRILKINSSKYAGMYIAPKMGDEGMELHVHISTLDENLVAQNEMFHKKVKLNMMAGINPLEILTFFTVDRKTQKIAIALSSEDYFQIDIFDTSGTKVEQINKHYRKIKLTERELKKFADVSQKMKERGDKKNFVDMKYKKSINMLTSDSKGRLWVATAKNDTGIDSSSVCMDIFENGKFLNTIELPFIKNESGLGILKLFDLMHIKDGKIFFLNNKTNCMEIYQHQ